MSKSPGIFTLFSPIPNRSSLHVDIIQKVPVICAIAEELGTDRQQMNGTRWNVKAAKIGSIGCVKITQTTHMQPSCEETVLNCKFYRLEMYCITIHRLESLENFFILYSQQLMCFIQKPFFYLHLNYFNSTQLKTTRMLIIVCLVVTQEKS